MSKREIIQRIERSKSKISNLENELREKKAEKSRIKENIREIDDKIARNSETLRRFERELDNLYADLRNAENKSAAELRNENTNYRADAFSAGNWRSNHPDKIIRGVKNAILECNNRMLILGREDAGLICGSRDAKESLKSVSTDIERLNNQLAGLAGEIKKEESNLRDEERKEQGPSSSLASASKEGKDTSGYSSGYFSGYN